MCKNTEVDMYNSLGDFIYWVFFTEGFRTLDQVKRKNYIDTKTYVCKVSVVVQK